MKPRPAAVALAVVCILVAAAGSAHAQQRPTFLDEPGKVVLPHGYTSEERYALYVFLPYTGGTSSEFYAKMASHIVGDEAIVLLPNGRPRSGDYLPDFMSFVRWYEERLLTDIASAANRYSIDRGRIVLVGHSLGGDLGWALSLRNPELFAGAVMAGTRASYPASGGVVRVLSERGFRGAFIVGENENYARATGIERAEATLREAGIETRFRTIPGGGHTYGRPADCVADLRWVLAGRTESRENSVAMPDDAANDTSSYTARRRQGSSQKLFPYPDSLVVFPLSSGWSDTEESRRGVYDAIYDSANEPLRIRMYYSSRETIRADEHLALFVDGLPFTSRVEFHDAGEYFRDYRDHRPWPVATGVTEDRWFVARAFSEDGASVLVVVSVPKRLKGQYAEELEEIIR
jgi:predicted esterase